MFGWGGDSSKSLEDENKALRARLQELQNAIRQGVRKEVASFHKGKGRFGRGLALRIAYF
jgi:tyrosine-protein phosphatase YwqE